MYNLPEMRSVNAAFWTALKGLLSEANIAAPDDLLFERPPVPDRIGREVLLSQTCGYPLETLFRGQAVQLGTPCYDAAGCDGATHCGFFVVRADRRARDLQDLAGSVFLLNSRHSNSGMNLPRRALAEIAGGKPLFGRVIETGSQPGNLDRIANGEGDVTAVDSVTYAFWAKYRPAAASRTAVLGRTPPSPAIPFITSAATPPDIVDGLRAALRRVAREPQFAAARQGLLIKDIVAVPPERYRSLLDYERDAARLGYAALA
jgi:ABC-type phosphate/phosphonate transport system substrate-binding protein